MLPYIAAPWIRHGKIDQNMTKISSPPKVSKFISHHPKSSEIIGIHSQDPKWTKNHNTLNILKLPSGNLT